MNAQTVTFAIQAGIQLYGAMRKAYADSTRGRPLILPLPRSEGIGWDTAGAWFGSVDSDVLQPYPRVGELMNKAGLTNEEKEEITELYIAIRTVVEPQFMQSSDSRGQISAEELSALVTVRQWSNGRYGPDPTGLQTIGGTLVNVGIDYFLQKPGAISEQSVEGRALRSFLISLDRTDFSTAAISDIAPGLMIALLESVSTNPDLIGGGEKEQLLVKNVTEAMLQSTKDLLENAPSQDRKNSAVWIQMIARSLISGASDTVLSNPQQFFKVNESESELIKTVGSTG